MLSYNVAIDALRNETTRCVIEALGPDFFGSINEKSGTIAAYDRKMGSILDENYELQAVSDFSGRVFIRK